MIYKKSISVLVIIITILSLTASAYGVFSSQSQNKHEFKSIYGETIQLHDKGLYQNDSVSIASQGISQDVVTMVICIPLLLISLYLFRKGLIKGRLLLAGTLGYFLYTYTSYTFLWMYNSFFLVYVVLMSASLFAFILTMMSFDLKKLDLCFSQKTPVKFLAGFLFFLAAALGFMWLGIIVPPLLKGTVPQALEHYTTLVIQAMDLGFVVPTAILSGVLILKRKPIGYLLTSVITIKGLSMATALTAMIIGQILAGVEVSFVTVILFSIINILIIYCMVLLMKNIKEPGNISMSMTS